MLDVGCGTGFFLEGAGTTTRRGASIPRPFAVDLCRARGLDRVGPGSAYDLSAVAGRRFDARSSSST